MIANILSCAIKTLDGNPISALQYRIIKGKNLKNLLTNKTKDLSEFIKVTCY